MLLFPITKVAVADDNEIEAIAAVEDLHKALIHNMKNAEMLGYQGRYENISPLINHYFDFPLIAKVILSRYWKDLGEENQSLFINRLKELTITTYAARFNSYTDEEFTAGGYETLKKGRRLIKTKIHSSDEESVSLNYLMHQKTGNWYIISVIANGVNDLSLKRAEYAAIIKEHGFDTLINQIDEKITEHEKF